MEGDTMINTARGDKFGRLTDQWFLKWSLGTKIPVCPLLFAILP